MVTPRNIPKETPKFEKKKKKHKPKYTSNHTSFPGLFTTSPARQPQAWLRRAYRQYCLCLLAAGVRSIWSRKCVA